MLAELSRLNSPTLTMIRKNFPKTAESKAEDDSQENSMLEEDELVQMKNDFIIEHEELIAYESLIRTTQMIETLIVPKKYTSIPSACLHQGLQFELLTSLPLFLEWITEDSMTNALQRKLLRSSVGK
jgi:hypothetical protein